jgi:hypothetical protein
MRHVPPKRRMTFNGLHDVISQKTELVMKLRHLFAHSSPSWHREVRILQERTLSYINHKFRF